MKIKGKKAANQKKKRIRFLFPDLEDLTALEKKEEGGGEEGEEGEKKEDEDEDEENEENEELENESDSDNDYVESHFEGGEDYGNDDDGDGMILSILRLWIIDD
jgi:hypothetical protein